MRSNAMKVEDYLEQLPTWRAAQIKAVRKVILDNLPEGYEEVMNWGMITYQVPIEVYPHTYNKKPLMYAALASQKKHMAVYLSGIYMDEDRKEAFETAYKSTGKRYDVGKSCVRFRKLEELPLELIGSAIASLPMKEFIQIVEHAGKRRSNSS